MATAEGPLRVYVREGGTLRHLASCDEDSLGFCLRTLVEERQTDGRIVGVQSRPEPDKPGVWLVHPFAKPGEDPVLHDPGQLRIR